MEQKQKDELERISKNLAFFAYLAIGSICLAVASAALLIGGI